MFTDMTQTFEEYCTDWIGLNRYQDQETGKWYQSPMERQEYYKIHLQGIDIRDSYDQLLKCETFTQ